MASAHRTLAGLLAPAAALALGAVAPSGCATPLPAPPAVERFLAAPLPAANTSVILRVLHVAEQNVSESYMQRGGRAARLRMPISAYVVEHPEEGLLLIDTGLGRASAESLDHYPGRAAARRTGLRLLAGPVADRLADIGARPEDVRTIVVTHLHTDHAGGIADFPGAELVIDSREWAAGATHQELRAYNPAAYSAHPNRRDLVYDDGPVGPFESSADLFGDGSVLLLPTPGHSPGHTSALVATASGRVLIHRGCHLAGCPLAAPHDQERAGWEADRARLAGERRRHLAHPPVGPGNPRTHHRRGARARQPGAAAPWPTPFP